MASSVGSFHRYMGYGSINQPTAPNFRVLLPQFFCEFGSIHHIDFLTHQSSVGFSQAQHATEDAGDRTVLLD
jgi:hypothetical protein